MEKGTITLPEVKITEKIPEGTINLPEVKIEGNPTPPPGDINIVDPNGNFGHAPIDWFLTEGVKKGYTLPNKSRIPSESDLDANNEVKVIRKSDNAAGTVPLDWFKTNPNAKNYELESENIKSNSKEINSIYRILTNGTSDEVKNLASQTAHDDVTDDRGHYKLIAPTGEAILADPKHLITLLSNDFKFKDPHYQDLIDAQLRMHKTGDVGESIAAAHQAWSDTFGKIGSWGRNRDIADKERGLTDKSFDIAQELASKQGLHKIAEAAGTVIGIGEQVLTPGGVFGEMKLANAAKAATLAKLAPEGASLGKQVLAKSLASAVEGVTIISPQVVAQTLIQKDPAAAVESFALGAGLGVLFAGAGGVLKLAKKGTEKTSGFLASEIRQRIPALEEFEKQEILHNIEKSNIQIPAENILSEVNKIGEKFIALDAKMEPIVKSFDEKITKLIDESGNISFKNLYQFNDEVSTGIYKTIEKESAKKGIPSLEHQLRLDLTNASLNELGNFADKVGAELGPKGVDSFSKLIEAVNSKTFKNAEIPENVMQRTKDLLNLGIQTAGAGIGGAVGAAVGGYGGFGVGGYAGKKVGEYASKLLTDYIDNPANASKMKPWLAKKINSGTIGSYLILDMIHNISSVNKEIPAFVKTMSGTAKVFPMISNPIEDPIKTILGKEANGLSKAQQFQRVSDQFAQLAGNKELLKQQFDDYIFPVLKDHPELIDQLLVNYSTKIDVINKILHDKNNQIQKPFQKPEKYQPSPRDLKEIEDQLRVAINPYILLQNLKDGTITTKQVQVAVQLNPAILNEIRTQLTMESMTGKTTLTYQQRLAMSVLMNSAMDQSMKTIPQLQNGFAPLPSQNKKGSNIQDKKLPQSQTLSQRLMGK